MGIKRGIIQSRGLGDILLALPIARKYYQDGDEIHWPVCEEFYSSLVNHVPWVTWYSVPTDDRGAYFMETPLQLFAANGVDPDEALYLYHYLNVAPNLTDPELFSILKFDQYKYAVAGVDFKLKWTLAECITRNLDREAELAAKVGATGRYAVAHFEGSTARARANVTWLDPEVKIIEVTALEDYSVFDWIGVLEGAEAVVCIDSVIANMTDQLGIQGPALYWIRRSGWDLTPVLGSHWTVVPTSLPIADPKRVDPAAEARKLADARAAAAKPVKLSIGQGTNQQIASAVAAKPAAAQGSITSHAPFQAAGQIPKNFMHALRK